MNTFSKILLSSVVGITSIFGGVSEAQARPSRTFCDETSRFEYCVSPVGYNSVKVTINHNYNYGGFTGTMNCSTGRYMWENNTGYSKARIGNILMKACNY